MADLPSPVTRVASDRSDGTDSSTDRRRTARIFVGGLAVLIIGSVLNPEVVATWADTRDEGWQRDLAHLWADPVVDISEAIGLDVPRDLAEELVDTDPAVTGFVPAPIPPARPSTSAGAIPDPGNEGPRDTSDGGPDPTLVTPPATTVAPRRASADHPLQVVAFGDSLMLDLQGGLDRRLGSRDDVAVKGKGALGFGFSKALWDWDEQVLIDYQRAIQDFDPAVVVVMIGANDFDNEEIDGVSRAPGSPAWRDLLVERGNDAISHWAAQGAHVYFWTTPLMDDDKFVLMPELNDIWIELADRWGPVVTILDSMDVLGDEDGEFRSTIENPDGSSTRLRKEDGVHFFDVGSDLLADQLVERMTRDGWLDPS